MTFEEIVKDMTRRELEQGNWPGDVVRRAAREILEGYTCHTEAKESAKIMRQTGNVSFTAWGYEVCAATLRRAIALDHDQQKNSTGRQTCCYYCHTCGAELRNVLDGELWCGTCQHYR